MAKSRKFVYFFGGGKAEGSASMKDASIVKLFCTESLQVIAQKAMVLQKNLGLSRAAPEAFHRKDTPVDGKRGEDLFGILIKIEAGEWCGQAELAMFIVGAG